MQYVRVTPADIIAYWTTAEISESLSWTPPKLTLTKWIEPLKSFAASPVRRRYARCIFIFRVWHTRVGSRSIFGIDDSISWLRIMLATYQLLRKRWLWACKQDQHTRTRTRVRSPAFWRLMLVGRSLWLPLKCCIIVVNNVSTGNWDARLKTALNFGKEMEAQGGDGGRRLAPLRPFFHPAPQGALGNPDAARVSIRLCAALDRRGCLGLPMPKHSQARCKLPLWGITRI